MNVTLPENISDITLRQFLKHEELIQRGLDEYNYNRRKVSLFANIPFKDTLYITATDYAQVLNQIDAALSTEAEFTPRFTMNGIEFGFIPDFDKITLGEYADLSQHGKDGNDTLHNLMAVLFRPIVKKEGDNYSIMAYNGTEEYAEMMKDMPMNCVNGALVFFYNLANDLQKATQKYLTEELQKEMRPTTTSLCSAGIQRLRDWLKTTSLTSRKSLT